MRYICDMIKYGFKIIDDKIYDTHISVYCKKATYASSGVIYTIESLGYKRLYLYEALLNCYTKTEVFEILKMNTLLKAERLKFESVSNKVHYMSNTMMVYNYPVKYLNARMFQLYKTCQKLKENIE
jgi:hypothetical protein